MQIQNIDPHKTFGGYNLFKYIFAKDATSEEQNFDLLISYLSNIYNRKEVDGRTIVAYVNFDLNETFFPDDYPDCNYLFPITRLEAALRLWDLYECFLDKNEEYGLKIELTYNSYYDDTYDIDERIIIQIIDTTIPMYKRKIRGFFKSIPGFINRVILPPNINLYTRGDRYDIHSKTIRWS